MPGLTPLGTFHTAISLIAVGSGLVALVRDKAIFPKTQVGRIYVITTVITCVTGFGIFAHGTFGAPHVLGVITLAVLGLAAVAGNSRLFGRVAPYVETISYSATFLFHMIPAIAETSTRLPVGAPLLASAEAPALQAANAVMFVAFLIGAALQARHIHRAPARRLPLAA